MIFHVLTIFPEFFAGPFQHGVVGRAAEAGLVTIRLHDLRHTFASWYMMNGGDLYELAKILGHSNIKMTERYAKLGKAHIANR